MDTYMYVQYEARDSHEIMKKTEQNIETSERAKREGLRRLPNGSFKARHPDYDPEKAEKKVRVTPYLNRTAQDEDKQRK